MEEAQKLVDKFGRDIAWTTECLPVSWEHADAGVDVPVGGDDASIMDDGGPVCNVDHDGYGKEDDGGAASCPSCANQPADYIAASSATPNTKDVSEDEQSNGGGGGKGGKRMAKGITMMGPLSP